MFLVELASLRDPDLVTTEIQVALRAPSAVTLDRLRSLADFIGNRPILIVLDNCEHVRTPVARVAEALVDRCPRLRVLSTSRVVLGADGEHVFAVEPLAVGAEVGASPAVRLFRDRSGVEGDDESVLALVRRLDGLPLAIELAAARSRVFDPRELLDELDVGHSVLASIATDSRYQTLEEAIRWSHRLLEPRDRDLLSAVTVFHGSFTLAAARHVCGRHPQVGPGLARLVDNSLLTIFPHLDHPMLPENTMANAERWAEEIGGAAYTIDDATAIRVVDGTVDVISEGHWRKLRDGS